MCFKSTLITKPMRAKVTITLVEGDNFKRTKRIKEYSHSAFLKRCFCEAKVPILRCKNSLNIIQNNYT